MKVNRTIIGKDIQRGLLLNLLNFRLLFLLTLAGCASIQSTQSSYVFENITPTCAYNALKEMDGITKVWMSYDYLPPFPIISRSHLVGQDGIEFEGEGFFGFVSMPNQEPPPLRPVSYVNVYSDDGFLYRNFAIWGLDEILPRIEQIKEHIKESLFDSCSV